MQIHMGSPNNKNNNHSAHKRNNNKNSREQDEASEGRLCYNVCVNYSPLGWIASHHTNVLFSPNLNIMRHTQSFHLLTVLTMNWTLRVP
jgi:hypothetical protein